MIACRFKKTENMQKMLDETRKRRDKKHPSNVPSDGAASAPRSSTAAKSGERDIDSLVSSIKRKSSAKSSKDNDEGSNGKKRRKA